MLLTLIFSILIFSLCCLFFMPIRYVQTIKVFSLVVSALVLFLSCTLLVGFDCNNYYFSHVVTYSFGSSLINFSFSFGLDGISLFFFILTSFLIFLSILFIWNDIRFKEFTLNLLLIELLLLLVFSVLDLFLFYVFFPPVVDNFKINGFCLSLTKL